MAARRFIVYQDTPIVASSTLSPSTTATILAPSNSEKENIHPVTGQVAISSKAAQKAPKEKINVLATKFCIQDSVLKKKQKLTVDATEYGPPEPKKRKPSLSSRAQGAKAGMKTAGSARDRKAPRRVPLPDLEEDAADERPATQAAIDSRCVELTVTSLADVSEAFTPSSSVNTSSNSAHACNPLNVTSLRDYISVPLSSEAVTPFTTIARSHDLTTRTNHVQSPATDLQSTTPSDDAPTFSTPERKRIYSAFTFSSPSPAGKRLSEKPVLLDIDTIALFERLTLEFKE